MFFEDFQYYSSSIQTIQELRENNAFGGFQYYSSSIQTILINKTLGVKCHFQYYSSSIQTEIRICPRCKSTYLSILL